MNYLHLSAAYLHLSAAVYAGGLVVCFYRWFWDDTDQDLEWLLIGAMWPALLLATLIVVPLVAVGERFDKWRRRLHADRREKLRRDAEARAPSKRS